MSETMETRNRTRMERRLAAGKLYGAVVAVVIAAGMFALLAGEMEAAAENGEPPVIYEREETPAVAQRAAYVEQRAVEEAPHPSTQEEPEEEVFDKEAQPRKVLEYIGTYYITGYDICMKCCGKTDGITASGAKAEVGRTVAASKDFPFGTVLYIEGIGERVVEDRGVTGKTLDVLCNDHTECYAITGYYECYIVKEVWE